MFYSHPRDGTKMLVVSDQTFSPNCTSSLSLKIINNVLTLADEHRFPESQMMLYRTDSEIVTSKGIGKNVKNKNKIDLWKQLNISNLAERKA